ncbi:MAG: bifunctional UDP-N-acetylmuramoyl-tripeptide:D-alanyl-D-alanine ligase/alanine racemase [Chitinophagales bacterium]|nr:bifunctional UDP-N-acetylmuramoyl-tripeptide:D-alanyl-D-alanine ligase/alanine racemase [Chitinophagales bacterium]
MSFHSYHISEIAGIVHGQLVVTNSDDTIKNIALDSRRLTEPQQTLFFAIVGKRHDGHQFLNELYEKGVRNFVVSSTDLTRQLGQANIIQVADTLRALQQLVAHHRRRFQIPVIGITGSNGKTIIKEWLNQLLDEDFHIVRSPKSYNSQTGVPLSVWRMNDNHQLGIFEAGISEPGEMEHLEKIIKPTLGIFTNIGEPHSENFLNYRHKVKEKLKLFIDCETIIACKDHHEIIQAVAEVRQLLTEEEREQHFKLFLWSRFSDADLQITKIEKGQSLTEITGTYRGLQQSIAIPFTDDASIENAIHCWATLLYLGIASDKISGRMTSLGAVAMRLELKDAVNSCSLINDSYNSDLGSLSIALDFLLQQHQRAKKTVVLSDILQSGKNEQDLYLNVAELLDKKRVNRLIGIGPALSRQQGIFKAIKGLQLDFYESTDAFLSAYQPHFFEEEVILLKGARSFEFERISKLLEEQVHETVLEINLNALAENLQAYDSLLKPETKTMIMVKAFSYGAGGFEIANTLQYHRADYLAVAYADEGVALRKNGIWLPIMVMNPEQRSFENIIRYQLEPEIYSLSLLEKFQQALGTFKTFASSLPYPVHIEIDTGMRRLGFDKDELPELAQLLRNNPFLQVQSIFSHLSGSEDTFHDDFSREQIRVFRELSQYLINQLGYQPMRHILNSAGIVRFPEAHFDMVRLGLGLYGIDTSDTIQPRLRTIGTLKTTISQIKFVRAGETVGYSRSTKADKDMTIATIGIGYADGIDRRLSNGAGSMLVHGQLAPIVGRVCMDMCMLDITHIHIAKEGDEVIAFGPELPVQQVAAWAGTIPYEILTGISSRVKRVYFQE